eukprot:3082310-Lingulodinium_polyedra.AAC.1
MVERAPAPAAQALHAPLHRAGPAANEVAVSFSDTSRHVLVARRAASPETGRARASKAAASP